MRKRFIIPSLLAAGFLPLETIGHANAPTTTPADDDAFGKASLFDIFKQEQRYYLAAHRSHASHGSHASHASHRSSSTPSYVPPPSSRNLQSTPPSSILPTPPAAPSPLPGNSTQFLVIVMRVQSALSSFGYYTGTIDGVVGAQTAAAIAKFQQQWGLPITGTITPEVLNALGIVIP